jgi:hypothetical protein
MKRIDNCYLSDFLAMICLELLSALYIFFYPELILDPDSSG